MSLFGITLTELRSELLRVINPLNQRIGVINMNIQDLALTLQVTIDQLVKAHDEIVHKQNELFAKIIDLETVITAGGDVPAAVADELDALKGVAQSFDDIASSVAP